MVISHTSSVYEALKDELVTEQGGVAAGCEDVFLTAGAEHSWIKTKLLQNQDFAAFIESSLR